MDTIVRDSRFHADRSFALVHCGGSKAKSEKTLKCMKQYMRYCKEVSGEKFVGKCTLRY